MRANVAFLVALTAAATCARPSATPSAVERPGEVEQAGEGTDPSPEIVASFDGLGRVNHWPARAAIFAAT